MIIGISGKIGAGKDTVGEIIQYLQYMKTFNLQNPISERTFNIFKHSLAHKDQIWKVKKFADKLKDIVCLLISCTREELEDREFKEKELGEEWWYYKYLLHEAKDSHITNDFIRDKKGRPERFPIISQKTNEQEWKFLTNDFVSKMTEEEKEYHNVTLVKLTPRKILQLLGTECGREIIHPNIWVNALFSEYRIKNQATQIDYITNKGALHQRYLYSNWIITDVRFPNELQAIKDRGGISIRINRPVKIKDLDGNTCFLDYEEYIKKAKFEGWKVKELHPSETALDNAEFDYVINNNSTIEELIEKVKEILIKEKII